MAITPQSFVETTAPYRYTLRSSPRGVEIFGAPTMANFILGHSVDPERGTARVVVQRGDTMFAQPLSNDVLHDYAQSWKMLTDKLGSGAWGVFSVGTQHGLTRTYRKTAANAADARHLVRRAADDWYVYLGTATRGSTELSGHPDTAQHPLCVRMSRLTDAPEHVVALSHINVIDPTHMHCRANMGFMVSAAYYASLLAGASGPRAILECLVRRIHRSVDAAIPMSEQSYEIFLLRDGDMPRLMRERRLDPKPSPTMTFPATTALAAVLQQWDGVRGMSLRLQPHNIGIGYSAADRVLILNFPLDPTTTPLYMRETFRWFRDPIWNVVTSFS